MRNGNFSCICQIRVFPLWGDVSSETLTFVKTKEIRQRFLEDVSSEIAILGNPPMNGQMQPRTPLDKIISYVTDSATTSSLPSRTSKTLPVIRQRVSRCGAYPTIILYHQ